MSEYGSPRSSAEPKGFFGALFDFKFDHFITPMIVKLVYVIAMVMLVIVWLGFLFKAFSASSLLGVAVLIFGPIGLILELAFIRMSLEFYLAVVRLSEDVHHRGGQL